MSAVVRICLADDHPVFLAGVEALIATDPLLTLAGRAGTGPEALDTIRRERPDVAVLDVSMPGASGIEVTAQLTAEQAGTRVIILSMFEEPRYVRAAIEAGARGYVLKRSAADQLQIAIAAVQQGGIHVDPRAAGRLFAPDPQPCGAAEAPAPARRLTSREGDVLRATAFGYTIKEIATQFGITSKSVETYKRRAAEKLKLTSRAKIVRYAVTQGWFREASPDDLPAGTLTAADPRPLVPWRP